jgi:hypothetical protein
MRYTGWWACDYRDFDGRRRAKVFGSQEEAMRFANHPPGWVKRVLGKPWML